MMQEVYFYVMLKVLGFVKSLFLYIVEKITVIGKKKQLMNVRRYLCNIKMSFLYFVDLIFQSF